MTTLLSLRVSSLARLDEDVASFAPTHVVSLLDPSLDLSNTPRFDGIAQVLQCRFFDGDRAPHGPTTELLDAIIAFLNRFGCAPGASPAGRLLIHCHAGASRSTAVAYVALAMAAGPGMEAHAFDHLLRVTNKPWPNRDLTEIADSLLRREGRMVACVDAYRTRYPRRIHAYRRLNNKRNLNAYPGR